MTRFFFCMTIDTEPDDLWALSGRVSFRHFERLLGFHEELVARGARPTYLTTSEVVEYERSREVMERILATKNAEIGAHFHAWTRTWPFEVPDLGHPPLHASAHQLGQRHEEYMLEYTCRAIESNLGIRAISYRGGRWSLNGDSIQSLVNCGIRVDSTVTPGINWQDGSHPLVSGPDFRLCPRMPYFLSGDSLEPRANGKILELPVGTSFAPNQAVALGSGLFAKLRRKSRSLLRRPSGVLWLRPTFQTSRQLRHCLMSLHRDRIPVWVAMIHSSEIIPCTPLPSEREVAAFERRCLDLVECAMQFGAIGATLCDVWQYYQRNELQVSVDSKRLNDEGI